LLEEGTDATARSGTQAQGAGVMTQNAGFSV
jgi:hypothetical protein